jgi:hypothetical protein
MGMRLTATRDGGLVSRLSGDRRLLYELGKPGDEDSWSTQVGDIIEAARLGIEEQCQRLE